jgi:tetraacyldisaccharide 4'-kinase
MISEIQADATEQCGDRITEYLLSVSRGRRGLAPMLLRTALGAFAPVYCVGLKTYLLPYNVGLRKRTKLPCKVISIGNLTTGGTGKTPMTQMLCRLLTASRRKVAILSRGYGGKLEHGCAIVSDSKRVWLNAQEAGDEAYLLARTLPGIPVLIGKDRRVSGMRAVEEFDPDIIVLDDGMQYWQLHRDLDIALLNACEPFDNGWTFPRGLLREPPSHLARAGIVVLTNIRRAGMDQVQDVIQHVRRLAPGRPIFTADLAPTGLWNVSTGQELGVEWLESRRVAAVSAIGNPASFESMIGESGGILARRFRFRDHHPISLTDLEKICLESRAVGAEAIVVTAKDAVKLPLLKDSLPIMALQVTMKVDEDSENLFWCTLIEALHDWREEDYNKVDRTG